MIDELQKVGFNTRTNQEEKTWTQDEELRIQMEMKSLMESHKQKEKEVRNELQAKQNQTVTFYNQKVGDLEEAIQRQKQANEEANKQALMKIDKQQEEIKTLQKSYNIISH